MKNRILSVFGGVFAGWVIVFFGEMVTQKLYPFPQHIDLNDKVALGNYIQNMPTSALIVILVIWAVSAFTGGLVSGKISVNNWRRSSLITGAVLLAASLANQLSISHPLWVMIITILMYLPLSYVGGKLVNKG